MWYSAVRRSLGQLQLGSLPEVSACRASYTAGDFAGCLPAAERALDVARAYLPGGRDFALLSAVAGRCCWLTGKFPAAEAHFRAAAEVDGRLRRVAERAGAELFAAGATPDLLQHNGLAELNSALLAGGGVAVSEKVITQLRLQEGSCSEGSEDVASAWVSVGEAVVLGRLRLPTADAERLLSQVLNAPALSQTRFPSYATLRPRALQSLGTFHFRAQHAVTAEGLFRAAKNAWTSLYECNAISPRAAVQRAQGSFAYGEFLHKWEKREREGDAEMAAARTMLDGAEGISDEAAAWAAVVLPPLDVAPLIEELWS